MPIFGPPECRELLAGWAIEFGSRLHLTSGMAGHEIVTPRVSAVAQCMDRLASGRQRTRPLSTYRLQLHSGFRFEDARTLVPYLHALGISHYYVSPILKSRAGSTHGYDITDHNQLDPEIGSEEDFHALVSELRRAGLGLILDLVPNHMGVGHGSNPWWQDVLQNGQSSRYAHYFDIDWTPLKNELRGKVLLPILGASYGEELDQGHIAIDFNPAAGEFNCNYYDNRVALDPQTYPLIFEGMEDRRGGASDAEWKSSGQADLEVLLDEFRTLPPHSTFEGDELHRRRREVPRLTARLAKMAHDYPAVAETIERAIRLCNGRPGDHRSFDLLHRLLEAQSFRLAHWRVSGEEINYRRFFDINDLVGLCMEVPEVFDATHKLIRRLLAESLIDGVRLDHPDGLFNPVQYFTRLQMLYAAAHCCGPEPSGALAENGIETDVVGHYEACDWQEPPLYTLVEKILEHGEELPRDWPVAGTVGYEFGNLLNGIFIETRNARPFTTLYNRFIGAPMEVAGVIYAAKKLILKESLAGEALVLMHLADRIASADRYARDFTRAALLLAIRETIACFPVYRTYIDERGNVGENDRRHIEMAIARAKRRNEGMSTKVFDFLRDILLLRAPSHAASAADYKKRLRFTLKFQQLTGPVMAKGLEDTACYVYNRLLSENEVGSSPEEFGFTTADFHAGNGERRERWPDSMLGTSTHDSKRSEDVRARLNVLTEMPKIWGAAAMRWRRLNNPKKRAIGDGRLVPDRNEEYLLYQTLVGVWPLKVAMDDAERKQFIGRMQQYMSKAAHEAKVNLSWTNQNPEYVQALEDFVARLLQPGTATRPNLFLRAIEQFLPTVQFFGCINSVAQVLLKLTSPGLPDIYQGQELWDFSLVDPDNRRPVDFARRQQMLETLLAAPPLNKGEMLREFEDGRLKLWTTAATLRFRRDHPEIFKDGGYRPLEAHGAKRDHLVAFARERRGEFVVTAVPRLAYTLCSGDRNSRFADSWGDTRIMLPSATAAVENVLTGEKLQVPEGSISCRELFSSLPIALLTGETR
jgi:(1->4)-alpha-D-glucan 1-alpha-D-glucosylmutase